MFIFIIYMHTKENLQFMEKCTANEQTYQKQFVKFFAGNFALNDVRWLGKLIEVYSNQMKALLKYCQCYLMQHQRRQ